MSEKFISIKNNLVEVKVKSDYLDVSEKEVLKFHPWIKNLLDEIKSKGWNYQLTKISGEALISINLKEIIFNMNYYPPRIDEFEEEGKYSIEFSLKESEAPKILKILKINSFKMDISTPNCWHAVSADPFTRKITYVCDVLHNFVFNCKKRPKRLSEAKEVYEVVKWFLEKGYQFSENYVEEDFAKLVKLFEKPYSFSLKLELIVRDMDKVPGWDSILNDLVKFFNRRGILIKFPKEYRGILSKKPLP